MTSKQQLMYLMCGLLSGKYSARAFCEEFTRIYDFEIDINTTFPSTKANLYNRRKGHINATYADNLCLPFALLLANTFLPLAVCILFLKP